MPEVKEHTPGSFCWIELGTSDTSGAKKFYKELFGWSFVDSPMGPDEFYTIFKIRDLDVAAMYTLREDQTTQGVPPNWMTYVSVASADDAAKKAASLGGKIVAGAFDVMEAGRMAVLQDPQGATFCAWEAKANTGIGLAGEPGTLCWDELWTTDHKKAADFYSGLFGWAAKDSGSDAPAGNYTEWVNDGKSIGGMLEITPEMGPVPPNWLPYFLVEDCDAGAEKAKTLGGKLQVSPMDIPNVGRFSAIQDPQGATFAIFKPALHA
jgi:predicted enzyme related to lactoylglutathione lyase